MSTKQQKLDFVAKVHECLEDGSDAALEQVFAQDFKLTVPGTNGRGTGEPFPEGIAGTTPQHFPGC